MTNVTVYSPTTNDLSSTNHETDVILYFHRSRLLWRLVLPVLFESDKRIALKALDRILQSIGPVSVGNTGTISPARRSNRPITVRSRSLKLASPERQKNLTLWLQPSLTTQLENAFESRLIAWEHRLIKAQTIAAYLATLGGGFFMCHHFSTAVTMAVEQQQMAIIINDSEMYFKCIINRAYNYIHSGRFATAKRVTLLAMCEAALFFNKRCKKAAKVADRSLSKTVDDFARIRLQKDASSADDIIVPFTLNN
jgi:hypothetical protein